ncbi:MAG: HEAT repeat domain-containing protein [Simkaniaceae bacterium]|nr:HEAT repeat domain-containing protein [Simkaniaceae bacterium]MCF7851774.1 HEAT repeat domain-containing protein [Simkaniaceae bacterium]
MAIYKTFCLTVLSSLSLLWSDIDPRHVLFLMSAGKVERAIEAYQNYHQETGLHDFEILEEIGRILIEQGCASKDLETGMISLYGAAISSLARVENFLEHAVRNPHPNVQLVALQLLSRMNNDAIDDLIAKGMSSEFLMIRLETLHHLTARRSKLALAHTDSLMRMLPHEFKVFFPDFFASLDSPEATSALKALIADRDLQVRLSALLSVAKYMRDDLLPDVKTALSHPNPAEREASALVVGFLNDSSSIEVLKELLDSPYEGVRLAALLSLFRLGDESMAIKIQEMAMTGNPFAIQMLSDLPLTEDLLYNLSQNEDPMIQLNAVMALLRKRDPRSLPSLMQFLIRDMSDIGFIPNFSLGRAFIAWRPVPSATQQAEKLQVDLPSITWNLKEEMLMQAMELPNSGFISLAKEIFDRGQQQLIPLVVRLLENIHTDEAITLLQYNANRIGSPLIRSYCLLGLYRLGNAGEYGEKFLSWINEQKGTELIRFRPIAPRTLDVEITSNYHLTPEENSALLVESFEAIARKHETLSIDCILNALKDGNIKNRPALGGLLLLAIH